MATKQGMCRNCGSLVVFDDRDEMCECVFCHCVFPSQEAVSLLDNHDGHEFKNEKFEVQEGSKHYYSNPVMPDMVQKAVQREAISDKGDDLKLKPSEFEVSPNDVKAPKKLVIEYSLAALGVFLVIVLVSLPLYLSRTKLEKAIMADIDTSFNSVVEKKADDAFERQYLIYGLTCQYIKVVLPDGIDQTTAQNYYNKYCELRTSKREGNASGNVKMEIFTPDTIYHVTSESCTVEAQETVQITESTAASETTK